MNRRFEGANRPGVAFLAAAVFTIAGLCVTLFAWWIPERHRRRMAANERAASVNIRTLATAEAEFRANDLDANRVNDFWTGDVTGLWHYGRLIERSLAEADARPLRPLVARPTPKAGYFFVAMEMDDSSGRPEYYKNDTDGTGRKVHHNASFGFCAYPAEYGVTGRVTYFINESNTLFKVNNGGLPLLRFPCDSPLSPHWEKFD